MAKIFNRILGLEGWSRYHRGVLYLMLILIAAIFYQAWWAYDDGTYIVKEERIISAPVSDVWTFVTANQNRVRWYAYITRINKLAGEPGDVGSTRLLDWKSHKGEQWTAFEKTDISHHQKYFKVVQNAKRDTRIQEIYLMPEGECKTQVSIRETIYHQDYDKRLLVPFIRFYDIKRLDISFKALDRWMKKVSSSCP